MLGDGRRSRIDADYGKEERCRFACVDIEAGKIIQKIQCPLSSLEIFRKTYFPV